MKVRIYDMTNQRYLKSMEFSEMLVAMQRNIRNGADECIIDAITGEYMDCPKKVTCRECIEKWLKAEKEDNE